MRVLEDFDLTSYNSYRVNSKCNRAFFPQTEDDFIKIYRDYPSSEEKVILGGGNNVILSKECFENDFILIGESFADVKFQEGGIVEAEAGADLKRLSKLALEYQLTGLEMFYDIPSSLGGAVVMNAGAGGEDIKGILAKVRYLDMQDMRIKEILKEDIDFEYRNSFFQRNKDKIVLRVWLSLNSGDPEFIKAKMDVNKAARWAKQPKDYPNAGSVFKRPKGHFVGPMIEGLGLKGHVIGGAKVSEKHAGFIVNFDKASGRDILELVYYVKEMVLDHFGVDLEIEQRII